MEHLLDITTPIDEQRVFTKGFCDYDDLTDEEKRILYDSMKYQIKVLERYHIENCHALKVLHDNMDKETWEKLPDEIKNIVLGIR